MAKYYVYIIPSEVLGESGGFKEVEGESVIIAGFEELDLFMHHPYGHNSEQAKDIWLISEVKSGMVIAGWANSPEQAKKFTTEKLESVGLVKFHEILNKQLEQKEHRSPRYAVGGKNVKP